MPVAIRAILGFDGKRFDAGIKKAKRSVAGLGKATQGALKSQLAGVLTFDYISNQMRAIGNFSKEVTKLAPALGMTTDELQQWQYVFARAGLEVDDVADAFATLADRTEDALDGTVSMIDDFKLIGITIDDLRGKNPQQLFELFADGVRNTSDKNRALAAIVRNLGDDLGRKLAPALMKGSEGLANMKNEAKELGLLLDEGQLKEVANRMVEIQIATMQMRSMWADITTSASRFFSVIADSAKLLEPTGILGGGLGYMTGMWENDSRSAFNPMKWIDMPIDFYKGMVKTVSRREGEIVNKHTAAELLKIGDSGGKPQTRSGEGVNEALKLAEAKAALDKKIKDIKFKELSTDQKINTLMEERAVILEKIRKADGIDKIVLLTKELDLNERLNALRTTDGLIAGAASGGRGQGLTASQTVGAFVQRNNPLLGVARAQLRYLMQIKDNTEVKAPSTVNNPHGSGTLVG